MKETNLFMYAHLIASRHLGLKKYFGVVGKYLMELLDEEPILQKLSKSAKYDHLPSIESRMTGADRRMILKSFTDDSLIVFTSSYHADPECYKISAFYNASQVSDIELLREASALSHHRWQNKKEFVISSSKQHGEKLSRDGYSLAYKGLTVQIFEKTL